MPRPLPSFQKMWKHYPDEKDPVKVKKLIGGKVNYPWITNTCTIRLSRAFNYAGDPIRKGYAGLNAVSGADRKWYAFRVRELEKYLRAMYGDPQVEEVAGDANKLRAAVKGYRGVIQFNVRGWSDATGHLDIWDGTKVRFSEYFSQADGVNLWRFPG
ncbi:MAG: type VI secretion system amidase effector protein Tae4 [Candidatus Krumholzibacteria bacterium]